MAAVASELGLEMNPVALNSIGIIVLFQIGAEIVTRVEAVLLTLVTDRFPLSNISVTMFDTLNLFPLIACPLFAVTGEVIAEGSSHSRSGGVTVRGRAHRLAPDHHLRAMASTRARRESRHEIPVGPGVERNCGPA